jgi:hypothetical protein
MLANFDNEAVETLGLVLTIIPVESPFPLLWFN